MIDANAAHSLSRFIEAQNTVDDQVLWELNSGNKSRHWMWFIFPQMKGLGMSSVSNFYGISGIEEVMLYWNHDLLGTRLRECIGILLALPEKDANKIFSYTDAMKLRSCLTLFNLVDDSSERWTEKCLQQYFAGLKDKRTLLLLGV